MENNQAVAPSETKIGAADSLRPGGRFLFLRTKRSKRFSRHASVGDSCGCKMGASFLAAGLIASTVWYVWHWLFSPLSLRAVLLRIFLWSFLAAGFGKIAGIIRYRFRQKAPPSKQIGYEQVNRP